MHPGSADDEQYSQHSGKHSGVLRGFDVSEDSSDEAADPAKESDSKKDHAGQNEDVGNWRVGEMVHGLPSLSSLNAQKGGEQMIGREGKDLTRGSLALVDALCKQNGALTVAALRSLLGVVVD
jgi:hypothetical protein